MQYQLFTDNPWLPPEPSLGKGIAELPTIFIDLPQLFAVEGVDSFYKFLGIRDTYAHSLFTNLALKEKCDAIGTMMPVLEALENKALKEMNMRMSDETRGLTIASGKEIKATEGAMLKASNKAGGYIYWILSSKFPGKCLYHSTFVF